MIRRLVSWLTDQRRQAIHGALASLAALVMFAGVITENQAGAILTLSAAVLQVAQGVLGLALLRRSERFRWFDTVGRGLVYSAAAAGAAVGEAFRFWDDGTTAVIVTVASLALTALSSVIAIFNVQTVEPASPDFE